MSSPFPVALLSLTNKDNCSSGTLANRMVPSRIDQPSTNQLKYWQSRKQSAHWWCRLETSRQTSPAKCMEELLRRQTHLRRRAQPEALQKGSPRSFEGLLALRSACEGFCTNSLCFILTKTYDIYADCMLKAEKHAVFYRQAGKGADACTKHLVGSIAFICSIAI